MRIKISVIISTFNPNLDHLNKTLLGLKQQTFPIQDWELIIVDNNSDKPFSYLIDISWNENNKIIKEPKIGLTNARLRGFSESKGDLIIMVDDDNILRINYLNNVYDTFKKDTQLGAIGGKSLPLFNCKPPIWIKNFYTCLALRDLGEKVIVEKWKHYYPDCAPIGAGMAVRKSALKNYINKVNSGKSLITDRKGTSLSSGGDNDIVLEVLKDGWKVAYIPSLYLDHIIPKERISKEYLGRLNKDSAKSWIILLDEHNINPWAKISKLSVSFRKIKAWFVYKPWLNEINYIRFNGACGQYEALSELG
ncbi:glycosyltransferase [Pedobacter psychrotolerans]|uniref:glycosyltransferase n=1 Tax=Pedobacter psychrotolerans TaxID=1843235 RepID=UPI003F9CF0E6